MDRRPHQLQSLTLLVFTLLIGGSAWANPAILPVVGAIGVQKPRLSFTTAAQTLQPHICSSVVTVRRLSRSGTAQTSGALTVNLSGSATMSFYSDPSCTTAITSVTIANGTSTANFYFLNTAVESNLLTASATAYSSASQTETVTKGNFVWTGNGADANWSTGANWSGGVAPNSSTAVAIFDGTCTSNCSPTISASIAANKLGGVVMTADYTGTITQSSGSTITIGAMGWVQAGGTFVGSNSADTIDLDGHFKLTGGTFTSTRGTLDVDPPFGPSATIFNMVAGTFNHNNGTVQFSPSGGCCSIGPYYISVPTSLTLYNVTINGFMSTTNGVASYVWVASGDTVVVANDLNHESGAIGGNWTLHGNLSVGANAGNNYPTQTAAAAAAGTITFAGSTPQTYAQTAPCATFCYGTGNIVINNANGVTPAVGTTSFYTGKFTLTSGSFTAPSGTMMLSGWAFTSTDLFTVTAGTTFSHNNGTVVFAAFAGCCDSPTFGLEIPSGLTLYDVTIKSFVNTSNGSTSIVGVNSGQTLTVAHTLNFTSGAMAGAWILKGDLVIGSIAHGGTATLTFNGTSDQTITAAAAGTCPSTCKQAPSGAVTINTSQTIHLGGNLSLNNTGQTTTVQAGTLDMAGYNLTLKGLTMTGGVIQLKGTGASAGTLTINGASQGTGAYQSGTITN
ncbi:MAG: hypothetical protein AB7G93_02960 [Bdellovibrionales bacterium]